MSIVLGIIATVTAGGIVLLTASVEKRQWEETETKLAILQKALLDYRRAFNRLPCPADAARDMNATANNYYGVEAASPGVCKGGTPAANFPPLIGTLVEGMAPVKALGLPDDMAIDGWGRRIMYAVDRRYTNTSLTTNPFTSGGTIPTSFTIEDTDGQQKTQYAVYVLLSFGPNGHGAIPRNATSLTRLNGGAINPKELANCGCLASGATNGTGIPSAFIQDRLEDEAPFTNSYFDDIVVFATYEQLRRLNE